MPSFLDIKTQINLARANRDQLESKLFATQQNVLFLENTFKTFQRRQPRKLIGPGGVITQTVSAEMLDCQMRLTSAKNLAGSFKTQFETAVAAVKNLENQYAALGNPQTLVENLNDTFPILLLPVRIESRFMKIGATTELWLRFFPDDIHIETHEPELTADELAAAKIYWQAVWTAKNTYLGPQTPEREAWRNLWRNLCRSFGAERAAWIVQTTTPTNLATAGPNYTTSPTYPTVIIKTQAWSKAPCARTLPERFVVRLYKNDTAYREVVGNLIPSPLVVGPHPTRDDDAFRESSDGGRLEVDPEMKWMVDFPEAIAVGMGIKIPLAADEAAGLPKIVVLGLRILDDADAGGKAALENLFNNHRFSPGDLSLIRQGTPTNNTKDTPSGFNGRYNDPDEAFEREIVRPLVAAQAAALDKTDGQWLAEALGISYPALQHLRNSEHTDVREALAMNQALFPATLGYFMQQMIGGEWGVTPEKIDAFRNFFSNHISARGFVPAIRVGKQPYGILPASAYSKMVWKPGDEVAGTIQNILLNETRDQTWKNRATEIKTVTSPGDWQQTFMDILGLNPSSVEFYQQFMLGPQLYEGICRWLSRTNFSTQSLAAKGIWENFFKRPPSSPTPRVMRSGLWGDAIKLTGPLVDTVPLSETGGLSFNYIQWLVDKSLEDIRNQKTGVSPNKPALLYLLLRQAFLLENWSVAIKILTNQDASTDNPFSINLLEEELFNTPPLPNACTASRWDALFFVKPDTGPGNKFSDRIYFDRSGRSMSVLLKDNVTSLYPEHAGQLKLTQTALKALQKIPTARLERCLTEHLDLCSYRMDAWLTGLVNYRLNKLRRQGLPLGQSRSGIYLGAFGWLLNLKPGPALIPVPPADIPANFINPPAAQPLTSSLNNAGFVHAPSPRQAVTAALLRNGYLSRGRQSMEVNLSSRRVRQALEIIEGLQNGHELGALLGYRLERALKESTKFPPAQPALRHVTIRKLREIYPLTETRKLSSDPPSSDGSTNVVHGLNVLMNPAPLNTWLGTLGALQAPVKNVLTEETDKLKSILDAVADLGMAEGVYQAVGSNFERANAILNSMGDGKMIPSPEVIRTPRTGRSLTQRVGFLFTPVSLDAASVDQTRMPWSWPGSITVSTLRALGEPSFNLWLGKTLGDPAAIFCEVRYPKPDKTIAVERVTVADLRLQPLDLLHLMNDALDNNAGPMVALVRYHVARKYLLPDALVVQVDFRPGRKIINSTAYSFNEIMPLVKSLRRILGGGRPLHAQDFMLPNEEANAGEAAQQLDYKELLGRVQLCYKRIDEAKVKLDGFVTNPPVSPKLQAVCADDLWRVAREMGVEGVLADAIPADKKPLYFKEKCEAGRKELKKRIDQAKSVFIEEQEKFKNTPTNFNTVAFDQLMKPVPPSQAVQASALIKIMQALWGGSFPVFPFFQFKNNSELARTYDDGTVLLTDMPAFAFDQWLYGVAKVREPMKNCQLAIMLQETLQPKGASFAPLVPLQLPYFADSRWAALQLPYAPDSPWMTLHAPELLTDVLSLAVQLPDSFDPAASTPRCGLLLDSWSEVIPSKEETTGIAFHYDAPQTEPPQTLLLAVAPDQTGKWKWNDLVDTLTETLELAKKRGVDPDLLAKSPPSVNGDKFNLLLPGIVSPVAVDPRATITMNFADNNISPK